MPARLAIVVLVLLAGWTGTASAGVVHARVELQLAAERTPARHPAATHRGDVRQVTVPAAPFPFHLVGAHWRGPGTVDLRWRRSDGSWSAWSEVEQDRGADPREAGRAVGWRLGEPTWTGPSVGLEVRVRGRVDAVAVHYVRAPPLRAARRSAIAEPPALISRAAWGADESIVRAPPYYADRLERAIVHHTAGALPATPEESAQIVRAIQVYHVSGNGWNDIGYNFLVDPFGQVFEGRGGGVDRPVVGAHVRGFNTGAVGVAVLGNYESDLPTAEARSGLVRLLAWRLDVAHVDPASLVTAISAGNQVYPAGVPVTLRAIAGHRDMDLTACPGGNLYTLLDAIAAEVAATGGPKLFEPRATPSLVQIRPDGTVEPVRITARLSAVLPWAVTIADSQGRVVAATQGLGPAVDWTWDGIPQAGALLQPGASLTATISADPSVLPAQLTLAAGTPVASVTQLRIVPSTITPDADGLADTGRITFSLAAAATATVAVARADGSPVATLLAGAPLPAGPVELVWDGTVTPGQPVEDGRYRLTVVADAGSSLASAAVDVTVDRTLGPIVVPERVSPNGDGRRDVLPVRLSLRRPAAVDVTIRRGSSRLALLEASSLAAGDHVLTWMPGAAKAVPGDGAVTVVVRARTELGVRVRSGTSTLDRTAPRLAIREAWVSRRAYKIVAVVTEPARVRASSVAPPVLRVAAAPGRVVIWSRQPAGRVMLRAWDDAGNASDPVVVTLLRRRN